MITWAVSMYLAANMIPAFMFISAFGYKTGPAPLRCYWQTWMREPQLILWWIALGPFFWLIIFGSAIHSAIVNKKKKEITAKVTKDAKSTREQIVADYISKKQKEGRSNEY